jgi:AraC-like DNA-binding protein
MITANYSPTDRELSGKQTDVSFMYKGELLRLTCRILESGISERPEVEEFDHPNPPFSRLFLCEKSGAWFRTRSGERRLEQGMIYLLPPKLPFYIRYDEESTLVYFHLYIFDYFGVSVFDGVEDMQCLDNAMLLHSVCHTLRSADMLDMSVDVFRCVQRFVRTRLDSIRERHLKLKSFLKLVDYLREHSSSLVSVGELAELYGITANTLSKRFKRATGISLKHYLMRNKLQQVQELLLHSSLSVVEISEVTGFSSSQYLQGFFRMATGITPAWFRRLHQIG